MITVKVIFEAGHTMLDHFSDTEDASSFFSKWYPEGNVTYEILGEWEEEQQ